MDKIPMHISDEMYFSNQFAVLPIFYPKTILYSGLQFLEPRILNSICFFVIPISLYSEVQDSGFHKQNFSGFQSPQAKFPIFWDPVQPLQSTNSQSNASTPIVPRRPSNESGRINHVLVPLLEVNTTESVQGRQVPVEILDQLKSFIQKQEEFNQCLDQRIEDNINQIQQGREKKSRRLPKALTVS